MEFGEARRIRVRATSRIYSNRPRLRLRSQTSGGGRKYFDEDHVVSEHVHQIGGLVAAAILRRSNIVTCPQCSLSFANTGGPASHMSNKHPASVVNCS